MQWLGLMRRLGERLKSEREAQGIKLEDLSARTRVSVRLLSAIESEDFDQLPGGVFNVSFVRQYARHVGLDEDEIVAEFNEIARPGELKLIDREQDPASGIQPPPGVSLAERFVEYARRYQLTPPVALTLVLVMIATGVMFSNWDWDSGFSSVTDLLPRRSKTLAQDTEAPALSAEEAARVSNLPPSPPPAPPKAVRVLLEMSATVWIRASADEERQFQRTFQAGDSRVIEGDESVRLLIGNAGAVAAKLNGEPLPRFGGSGQVRRVLLTPAGMEIIFPPKKPEGSEKSTPVRAGSETLNPSDTADPVLAGVHPSN